MHGYASPLNGPIDRRAATKLAVKRQATANASQTAALPETKPVGNLRDGKRSKDGQPMKINLVSSTSGDYPKVVAELKNNGRQSGDGHDTLGTARGFQQLIVLPRDYDALVYELQLGRPDVFAYWHS